MNILKITIGLIAIILLSSCRNSEGLADLQKFSTINEIYLGMKMAGIEGAIISKEKDNSYKVYKLADREINSLKGSVFLYVKNDEIEKIKFESSDIWLGSTSVANSLFDEFYNKRKTWIQDAMAYYEIPEWREGGNLLFYKKNGVVHQYELKKIEGFGVQMGWGLNYIITSENAIASDLQTEKDNLKF